MSGFLESSVVPAARPEAHVRPSDQVSWKQEEARLERREQARLRAQKRRGGSSR